VSRHQDTSGWYSSRRTGLAHAGFKTLVEDGTERIQGTHLLGPHAEEIINIFGLAIRAGLSASYLKDMVCALLADQPGHRAAALTDTAVRQNKSGGGRGV
jgi:pyridine nucleotide-disulfide oxidoreductase